MSEPIFKWHVGFVELLTLVLIGAKIADKTHLRWASILAPMWVPYTLRIIGYLGSRLVAYGKQIAETRQAVLEEEHRKATGHAGPMVTIH